MANHDADVTLNVGLNTKDVEAQANQLRNKIENIFDKTNGKKMSSSFVRLKQNMRDLYTKSNELSTKISDMNKQKFVPIDSKDYADTKKYISKIEADIDKLELKLREADALYGRGSAQSVAIGSKLTEKQVLHQDAMMRKADLERQNKAFTMVPVAQTEEYQRLLAEQARVNDRLQIATLRAGELRDRLRQTVNISQTLRNTLYRVKSVFSRLAQGARYLSDRLRGVQRNTDDTTKSLKKMLRFALKYFLGLRSIFILYKKIRSAGVEAYKGLASQFPELQAELNDLKNSFFQLKNSLATMAQPILSYLVPAIKTLMSWLTAAMNAIANFFAILTGAKYIYKATKLNKDWAKSASGAGKAAKEANEDIAEYDNLILIQQDKDSGGGGAGGAADDYAGAWEKVEAHSDFAQELKDAINRGDWEGAGDALAKRLNNLTQKLDDWIIDLRPKAKQWASNIGRFLNGLTDGWDSALSGKTLSDALMTIYDTIATFYETYSFKNLGKKIGTAITTFFTNWEPDTVARRIAGKFNAVINFLAGLIDKEKGIDFALVGKRIGETLKRTIERIEWKQLGADLSGLATGILEGLSAFITESKVGETVGNAINQFLSGIDFGRLAKDLSELATNILDALADAIETIDWTAVGQAIAEFLKNIDWGKFLTALCRVALGLIKGLGSALWEIITDPEALMSLATPLAAIFGAKMIWGKVSGAIAGGVGTALSGGLASATGGATSAVGGWLSRVFTGAMGSGSAGILGSALQGLIGGYVTFEGVGSIAGNTFSVLADAIFNDEALTKEYQKFSKDAVGYTVDTVKECFKAGSETSYLTGQSIMSNAISDWLFGQDIDVALENFMAEQEKIQEESYQKYLNMLEKRYKAGRAITDRDKELLNEYRGYHIQTDADLVTSSDHYADIAKKNAGVITSAEEKAMEKQKEAVDVSNHYAEIAQENAKKHVNSAAVMEQASNHHVEIAKTNAGVYAKIQQEAIDSSNHYADIAKQNAKSVEERSTEMVTNIEGAVATIPDEFDTTFSSAYDKMTSSFDATTTYFGNVAEGVKTPFESMADFFKTTFSNSWNGVVDVFKSNSPEFQSIQDSVSGVFRGSINSMITGINNTLAAPFSTLASVFSKMRNMEVGGAKIFSALPSFMVPKIPKLAQGAVLPPNSPFLAMVGDQKQGVNVETPLDTMIEAFKTAMAESGGNNNQPIVLNINGRQVAQAVWDEENKRYKQTGMRYRYS